MATIHKVWLGVLLSLLCGVACAQTTTSQLVSDIQSKTTNRGAGSITEFTVRSLLLEIANGKCGLAQAADCVLPAGAAAANLNLGSNVATGLTQPLTGSGSLVAAVSPTITTPTISGVFNQAYTSNPAITASGYGVSFNNNAPYSALSVVTAIFGNYTGYDALSAVADLPPSSTVIQANAVGGYCRARAANITSETGGFCVDYFGTATAEGQGSAVWGINIALGDDHTPGTYISSTLAHLIIGYEPDFYVYRSDTKIYAVQLAPANSSTVNPALALGFIVSPGPNGNGFWADAFVSQAGAATNALVIGALGTASGSWSQYEVFNYYNSSGVSQNVNVQADSLGRLLVSAPFVVSSSYLIADSVSLYNGAGSSAATMTNAPVAGNPTKWFQISDNGVTRYVPSW